MPVRLILIAVLVLAAPACAARPTPPTLPTPSAVAFESFRFRDADGHEIEAAVWAPAEGLATGRRRLVVISHGTGGDFRSHEGTARALAAAGFVAAALTHTGDNWRDRSRVTDLPLRPRQLKALTDHMLRDWEGAAILDSGRVGAFGFSAGGFTVLTAAGGRADLSRIADHCRVRPGFYDCGVVAAGSLETDRWRERSPEWTHDPRIAGVVAAAPALGFAFAPDGLSGVRPPVQLWRAGRDEILPAPFYAEAVRDALPSTPEYRDVPGAGHFDLMPPCPERLAVAAPEICAPTPGFDRVAFHDVFNREVIRFFRETL